MAFKRMGLRALSPRPGGGPGQPLAEIRYGGHGIGARKRMVCESAEAPPAAAPLILSVTGGDRAIHRGQIGLDERLPIAGRSASSAGVAAEICAGPILPGSGRADIRQHLSVGPGVQPAAANDRVAALSAGPKPSRESKDEPRR